MKLLCNFLLCLLVGFPVSSQTLQGSKPFSHETESAEAWLGGDRGKYVEDCSEFSTRILRAEVDFSRDLGRLNSSERAKTEDRG